MTTEHYRCWTEIDRSALRQNLEVVRSRAGGAELLAVVKANAYGHGMLGVAEAIADRVQLFGVANLEEAVALRAQFSHPIIILGPSIPAERSAIVDRGFIPTVSSLEEAQHFSSLSRAAPTAINFKVDTGMGRMGVPEIEALDQFRKVAGLPGLSIHSVSTHMPVSNEDAEYTVDELKRFSEVVKAFRSAVPGNYKAHVLQSAGTLAFADRPFDIIRAGIMMYGISPLPEFQRLLTPAMTWKARIGLVRELPKGSSISYGRTFITPAAMKVATLTAGYADGYPRNVSNRGASVLVRGTSCPLLGRVTMDLMMIDVSDAADAAAGDEVTLMGRDGGHEISATNLADLAGTISWEIVTRVGSRVRRVYV